MTLETLDYWRKYVFRPAGEIYTADGYAEWRLECNNLPLNYATHDDYAAYDLVGPEVQTHVKRLEYRRYDPYDDTDWQIESVEWDEASYGLDARFGVVE